MKKMGISRLKRVIFSLILISNINISNMMIAVNANEDKQVLVENDNKNDLQKNEQNQPQLGEKAAIDWLKKFDDYVASLNENQKKEIIDNYKKYVLQSIGKGKSLSLEEKKKIIEKHTPEAERLYNEILNFVKESDDKKILPVDFSEYIVEKLNEGVKTHKTKIIDKREDFIKFCETDKENKIRLVAYVGKKSIDDVKNGFLTVNPDCCNGLFCKCAGLGKSCNENHNFKFKNFFDFELYENDETSMFIPRHRKINRENQTTWFQLANGRVIEAAFDTRTVKVIDMNDLIDIMYTLLYNHPEFLNDCYKSDKKMSNQFFYSWPVPLLVPEFEKIYGIKNFNLDIADRLYPNHRAKEKEEANRIAKDIVVWFLMTTKEIKSASDRKWFEAYCKIMDSNKVKPHYIDKTYAAFDCFPLLAKLLGYDVLQMYVSCGIKKETDAKEMDKHYDYKILNPENIVICSDVQEPKEFSSGEEFLKFMLEKNKNNTENLVK